MLHYCCVSPQAGRAENDDNEIIFIKKSQTALNLFARAKNLVDPTSMTFFVGRSFQSDDYLLRETQKLETCWLSLAGWLAGECYRDIGGLLCVLLLVWALHGVKADSGHPPQPGEPPPAPPRQHTPPEHGSSVEKSLG